MMDGSITPTTHSYSGMYNTVAMDKLAAHEDDSIHRHAVDDLTDIGAALTDAEPSLANRESDRDIFSPRLRPSDAAFEQQRSIRRSISRSSSVISYHRRRLPPSDSLTKAEGHFLTLVDFLSSASREASTLKGFWSAVTAEKNAIVEERNELYDRIAQFGDQCEEHKQQRRKQERELAERQQLIEKLRSSLATATANEATEKENSTEAREEVKRLRQRLFESEGRFTNLQADRQSLASELDATQSRLRDVEEERDAARRQHHEHDLRYRDVVRERDELRSRFDEVVSQHEASKKEISVLKQLLAKSESERLSYVKRCEKASIEEKRLRLQIEECSKEILDLNERYRSYQQEIKHYQDTVSKFEQERSEHSTLLEQLRRDLRLAVAARAKFEEEHAGDSVRHEQVRQEIVTLRERITELEAERTSTAETIDQVRSQHRLLVVERNKLADELRAVRSQYEDSQQRIVSLKDEVIKLQSSLSQLRAERSSLLERAERIDRQLEDLRHHHNESEGEAVKFKRRISTLETELHTVISLRDSLQIELNDFRASYEDANNSCLQLRENMAEMDHDLDVLRSQLREAYEQRDRAIASRGSADKERDEYIKKYEEKCRQLEERPTSPFGQHHSHHYQSAYERLSGHMRSHFASEGLQSQCIRLSQCSTGMAVVVVLLIRVAMFFLPIILASADSSQEPASSKVAIRPTS